MSTLGELKQSGWRSRSVRDELRENLVAAIKSGHADSERWPGILGFDKTVLPQIENAILSRHDFILLGRNRVRWSARHKSNRWRPRHRISGRGRNALQ